MHARVLTRAGRSPAWAVTVVRDVPRSPGSERSAEAADEELVRASQAGETTAFDVLVTRHQRAIYRLCYRFVGNHEDASDVAQEVFLRAYRGLHRFRQHATLSTWLHRIAVNTSLSRVRSRGPALEPIDARPLAAPDEDLDGRLTREERAGQLKRAIAALPPKQRATVVLRVYHELSHQQIADVLGCTVGAAKVNFCHALRRLRRTLGEAGRD